MKQLPGCTIVELTEDKIVQEETYTCDKYTVNARHSGNSAPPPEAHQETINTIAKILLKGRQRRLAMEEEKVGA